MIHRLLFIHLCCFQCLFYSPSLWGAGILSLPFRPLRSRPSSPYMWAPHCGYRGSGDKLSQRVRPPSVFWCILDTNLHPFDCLMTNNFLFLLSIKKFPWYTCNSLSQPKTIEHTIFWRRGNSPSQKKMPGIYTVFGSTKLSISQRTALPGLPADRPTSYIRSPHSVRDAR